MKGPHALVFVALLFLGCSPDEMPLEGGDGGVGGGDSVGGGDWRIGSDAAVDLGTNEVGVAHLDASPTTPHEGKAVTPPKQTQRLKIMTFNIKGSAQNPGSLNRIAGLIAKYEPDLVGLEEVYNYVVQGANQASLVGTALSLSYGKKYQAEYLQQHSYIVAGIGVGILSKHPFITISHHTLPKAETEGRVVLRAQISTALRPVDFFVTHLTPQDSGVLKQAQDLMSWVGGFSGSPKILVGDFNEPPSSPTHSLVAQSFLDTWEARNGTGGGLTSPASKPQIRIDFVFADRASGTIPISSAVVGDASYSDHLAVLSTVDIVQ